MPIFHTPLNYNYVFLIKTSNIGESMEFLDFYLTMDNVISIITAFALYLSVALTLFLIVKKQNIREHYVAAVCIIVLMVSCGVNAYCRSWFSENNRRAAMLNVITKSPVKLKNPKVDLVFSDENRPENIIIIVGESLSPYHMSLYGYDKETTPQLKQLVADSLAVAFNHVSSPCTRTNDSFAHFMTVVDAMGNGRDFEECATLPRIMKQIGYKTFWFSNQTEGGFGDNVVTGFAHLCDTVNFVSSASDWGKGKKIMDEKLIPVINNYLQTSSGSQFGVIHLKGQHFEFEERYPSNRCKFSSSDYVGYESDIQRGIVAHYDNSVIYNDSVVNKLFRIFDKKDAIIFYFPDHSLDIFQTKSGYCSHAIDTSPESTKIGKSIPMIVYMSPEYQKRHGDVAAKLRSAKDKEFNTSDIIYTIMDIVSARFRDNDISASRSLLSDSK